MIDFSNSNAELTSNQQTNFKLLESLAKLTVGVKLFTIMEIDQQAGVAWRSFSSDPVAYPISGQKSLVKNQWYETVIEQQKNFVANTIEEIAAVFPDFELIQSLGCESCLNVPLVTNGRTVGTLNFLNVKDHFTPERISNAETMKSKLEYLINSTALK